MHELQHILQKIVAFRDQRNWKQFHTPRNLATALAIEFGELQETMLWKTDHDVAELLKTPEGRSTIASEIAYVLIYGLSFAETSR